MKSTTNRCACFLIATLLFEACLGCRGNGTSVSEAAAASSGDAREAVRLRITEMRIPAICRSTGEKLTLVISYNRTYAARDRAHLEALQKAIDITRPQNVLLPVYMTHLLRGLASNQPLPAGLTIRQIVRVNGEISDCRDWKSDDSGIDVSFKPLAMLSGKDAIILRTDESETEPEWLPATDQVWQKWWTEADRQLHISDIFSSEGDD